MSVHPEHKTEFRGVDKPDDTGTKGNESRFKRCKFCKAINDTELRSKGDGWGGNIQYDDISGTNLKQPITNNGCWFCGSSQGW